MRFCVIRIRNPAFLFAFLAQLAGCMVGPDFCQPVSELRSNWSQGYDPRINSQAVDVQDWWTQFNDPILNQLIVETATANLTLREAAERILEARARRDVAIGGLFPQSQTADGHYSKSLLSRNDANFFTFPGIFNANIRPQNWNLGLNAAWELDFWGRYRRAIESADASLDASIAAYDETRLLLLAEVGVTYIEMRTLEARANIAWQMAEIQGRTRLMAEQKLAAGLGSAIDTAQAEVSLRQTEAILPELEIARRQACHRLCVLQGKPPADLAAGLGCSGMIPQTPAMISVGLPADLLRQRPDIRRAERNLAAQSARIGIAEAEFLPHISLTGNIGVSSQQIGNLFSPSSQVGLIAPGFSWNLLNYARISNNVKAEEAVFRQLCAAYQSAVLKASQEAEDAMVSYTLGFEQLRALQQSAEASMVAVTKSSDLYQAGAIDFGRVYVLQTEALRQRDALASAQGAIAMSLVNVFKSLGGGWAVPETCFSSCPAFADSVGFGHSLQ
ncbi:MAG: efflux transporter outer membrane subunit [Planctomycetaceae bacterium]